MLNNPWIIALVSAMCLMFLFSITEYFEKKKYTIKEKVMIVAIMIYVYLLSKEIR